MATKKDIKSLLKRLNYTEAEMDNFWAGLYDINPIVKNLTNSGKSWRDLNTSAIEDMTTRKQKILDDLETKRVEEELQKEKQKEINDQKKYYEDNFEAIIISKIENNEKLSGYELSRLVYNYEIEVEYGDNSRWSRSAISIIQLLDRMFSVEWEQGLTESQEDEFYNQPYEVKAHEYEKTIIVKEWVAI